MYIFSIAAKDLPRSKSKCRTQTQFIVKSSSPCRCAKLDYVAVTGDAIDVEQVPVLRLHYLIQKEIAAMKASLTDAPTPNLKRWL